jgi:hypothetical protein
MKVDHAKDHNEKLLEKAADVLSHTIPEQKVDAMKDYHQVILLLEKGSDWRFKPILSRLQILYMFPNRKQHNIMIKDLHGLLEEIKENRINQLIEKQRNLGHFDAIGVSTTWPLFLVVLLTVWLWR